VPQQVVQTFIGHSSEAVYGLYIGIGADALEKAAAVFPDLL
jgi:hypothetical protein